MNDLSMELEIVGIVDGVDGMDGFQLCFSQSDQNNDVITTRNQCLASPSIHKPTSPMHTSLNTFHAQ